MDTSRIAGEKSRRLPWRLRLSTYTQIPVKTPVALASCRYT